MLSILLFSGFIITAIGAFLSERFKIRFILPAIAYNLTCLIWFVFPLLTNSAPWGYQNQIVVDKIAWVEQLGIHFSLRLDNLSLIFSLLILGIGFIILLYAHFYARSLPGRDRLICLLFTFMVSMLGLVLAANSITLFIFWEFTSVLSYLLISFKSAEESARENALMALVITSLGGFALLVASILLQFASGTYDFHSIIQNRVIIKSHLLYLPIVILIIFAAITKSAQFPLHFWLPKAMVAPTPVSAFLHSATMVKAGIYLLLRFHPLLGGTSIWMVALCTVGAITIVSSCFSALRQTDMKLLLAYSTVASLGIMFVLLGIGTELAINSCIIFLVAHAVYKGSAFLLAGNIEIHAKTRHIYQLGSLAKHLPVSFIAAVLTFGSMAGVAPFLGFYAKELAWQSLLNKFNLMPNSVTGPIVYVIVFGCFAVFVAIASAALLMPFLRTPKKAITPHREVPLIMSILPLSLGIFGIILNYIQINKATQTHFSESILWISVAAFITGLFTFTLMRVIRSKAEALADAFNISAVNIYDWIIRTIESFAFWLTGIIQNGYLRYYISTLIAFTVIFVAIPMFSSEYIVLRKVLTPITPYEIIIAGLILVASIIAISSISRLGAIVALGAVGYCTAIIYLFYGAPDLSMTQFLVDTISVIVFVLAFYHLPKFSRFSTSWAKIRDAVLAISFGSIICLLILSMSNVPIFPVISDYMADTSVSLAHGHNIVNTILVDYRGFDTLGEITVLALAAIGIYGLLKLKINRREEEWDQPY